MSRLIFLAALAIWCLGCARGAGSYSYTEEIDPHGAPGGPSGQPAGSHAKRANGRNPFVVPGGGAPSASPTRQMTEDVPIGPALPSPSTSPASAPPAPPDAPPPPTPSPSKRPREVAVVPRPNRPAAAGEAGERDLADRGTRLLLGAISLSRDGELLERADRIGQRLAAHSPRPNLPWTFEVLDSDILESLTVGLGRVYITRGLVNLLNDDELAGALSHSVAHVCMRASTHPESTQESTRMWLQRANDARERALQAKARPLDAESQKQYDASMHEFEECTKMARQSAAKKDAGAPPSEAEYDIDRCAATCLREAGWSPRVLVAALEKIRQQGVVGQSALMYSLFPHPPLDERIKIAERACR